MKIPFSNNFFNVGDKIARNVLVSTDQGLMIVNRFDSNAELVGHSQWLLDHGNCNTVESNDCYQAIKHIHSPIIFDVGSNIGTITMWLAKLFPQGEIYSFEPQRQVFYQLCGNISINNLYNVHAFNMALNDKKESIRVLEPNYFLNQDFGTFSLIESKIISSNKELIVNSDTVDNFISTNLIQKIDLLKIDAEGMDIKVLIGAKKTIENFKPVIYIEHFDNRTSCMDDIINFLESYNYFFDQRKNNLLCQI